MKLTPYQKLEVSYYLKEGFSPWEISEILEKPKYLIDKYVLHLYKLKQDRIARRGEEDKMLYELLIMFKINCESHVLQRNEVKKLIYKIEAYLK